MDFDFPHTRAEKRFTWCVCESTETLGNLRKVTLEKFTTSIDFWGIFGVFFIFSFVLSFWAEALDFGGGLKFFYCPHLKFFVVVHGTCTEKGT